jgi:hypothetical protein
MGTGGAIAAAAAGLLLFAVLACKLALYYEASSGTVGPSARATARALDASVSDGDLVVFTPGRGMSVYYYLRHLGYERRGERCENPTSGRWFFCANVSFDDESTVLDFDHLDRTAYSPDALRGDVRTFLAQLDPSRNSIWVEKRVGPSQWLAADRLLSQEAARAGFRRVAAPPPLRALRIWAHVGAD